MARLGAAMLVSALIRRIEAAGGSGTVLARGDATAGAVLIQLAERGIEGDLIERTLDARGDYRWTPVGPSDPIERADYRARRRRIDPDLWIVELDGSAAATIVAETAC